MMENKMILTHDLDEDVILVKPAELKQKIQKLFKQGASVVSVVEAHLVDVECPGCQKNDMVQVLQNESFIVGYECLRCNLNF
jgi:Zn ribbon nucleic-acid-binding protein